MTKDDVLTTELLELHPASTARLNRGGAEGLAGGKGLLEAALGFCLNISLTRCAVKHAMPVNGIRAEVDLDCRESGKVRVGYTFEVDGLLSPEQYELLRSAASACLAPCAGPEGRVVIAARSSDIDRK